MPGLLDANLCKNKQTNNNITILIVLYYMDISLYKVLFLFIFA